MHSTDTSPGIWNLVKHSELWTSSMDCGQRMTQGYQLDHFLGQCSPYVDMVNFPFFDLAWAWALNWFGFINFLFLIIITHIPRKSVFTCSTKTTPRLKIYYFIIVLEKPLNYPCKTFEKLLKLLN